jgi:hypothetical protein
MQSHKTKKGSENYIYFKFELWVGLQLSSLSKQLTQNYGLRADTTQVSDLFLFKNKWATFYIESLFHV